MRCSYGLCKSDSRYKHEKHMKKIFFIQFPKPNEILAKCERWVAACGRLDLLPSDINKNSYLCSKHFFCGNGPTREYPNPLPSPVTGLSRNYYKKRDRLKINCNENKNEEKIGQKESNNQIKKAVSKKNSTHRDEHPRKTFKFKPTFFKSPITTNGRKIVTRYIINLKDVKASNLHTERRVLKRNTVPTLNLPTSSKTDFLENSSRNENQTLVEKEKQHIQPIQATKLQDLENKSPFTEVLLKQSPISILKDPLAIDEPMIDISIKEEYQLCIEPIVSIIEPTTQSGMCIKSELIDESESGKMIKTENSNLLGNSDFNVQVKSELIDSEESKSGKIIKTESAESENSDFNVQVKSEHVYVKSEVMYDSE